PRRWPRRRCGRTSSWGCSPRSGRCRRRCLSRRWPPSCPRIAGRESSCRIPCRQSPSRSAPRRSSTPSPPSVFSPPLPERTPRRCPIRCPGCAAGAPRVAAMRGSRCVAGVLAVVASLVFVAGTTTAEPADESQEQIVGGEPAWVEDYPYVAYLANERGRQFCGAALFAPDRVVTAAHCVSREDEDSLTVVVGRQDVSTSDGHEVGVRRIWTHPEYRSAIRGYDVAVLELDRSVPYRPLRLATKRDGAAYQAGRKATVLGWGHVDEHGESSRTLRSAQVPVRSDNV